MSPVKRFVNTFLQISLVSGLPPWSCHDVMLMHESISHFGCGWLSGRASLEWSIHPPICDKIDISSPWMISTQPQREPWRTQRHRQKPPLINPKKWRTDRKMKRPPPSLPSNRKRRKRRQQQEEGRRLGKIILIGITLFHSRSHESWLDIATCKK